MIWTETSIASAIANQTLAKKCIVLVDNCNWTSYECDVLGVTTDLRIIDVEVKISRADLKADARKDKWWRYLTYSEALDAGKTAPGRWDPHAHREPRDWPSKVWKHYYALPADIWRPELLEALPSKASGVLLLRHQRNATTPVVVSVERRAAPNKDALRLRPESVVDIARLANIRMWEARRRADAAERELADRMAAAREWCMAG